MSRLDRGYLSRMGFTSWSSAFAQAAKAMNRPSDTFKNLRDEFDPYHSNNRQGWHLRPIRQSRQRVIDELSLASDDAVFELVRRILAGQENDVIEAVDSLAVTTNVAHNVAERLLTGRRAEEYFLENSQLIVGLAKNSVIDLRNAACGYYFGSSLKSELAIEVKGLRTTKGPILFTDREWSEARIRSANYVLVVVGNLAAEPCHKVFSNPYANIEATCSFQTNVAATWRSTVQL